MSSISSNLCEGNRPIAFKVYNGKLFLKKILFKEWNLNQVIFFYKKFLWKEENSERW